MSNGMRMDRRSSRDVWQVCSRPARLVGSLGKAEPHGCSRGCLGSRGDISRHPQSTELHVGTMNYGAPETMLWDRLDTTTGDLASLRLLSFT